ncbi:MAG: hypothetical protein ACI4BC_09815, partial [Muribaculaceae bacterium]
CFTNKEVELRVVIPIAKEGKPAAVKPTTGSKDDGKKKNSETKPGLENATPVNNQEGTPSTTPSTAPEQNPETPPTPGTTTNEA